MVAGEVSCPTRCRAYNKKCRSNTSSQKSARLAAHTTARIQASTGEELVKYDTLIYEEKRKQATRHTCEFTALTCRHETQAPSHDLRPSIDWAAAGAPRGLTSRNVDTGCARLKFWGCLLRNQATRRARHLSCRKARTNVTLGIQQSLQDTSCITPLCSDFCCICLYRHSLASKTCCQVNLYT